MGQLILIQGPDHDEVGHTFERALARFRDLFDADPKMRHERPGTAIATFPRLAAKGTTFARVPRARAWAAGAGSWFSSFDDAPPSGATTAESAVLETLAVAAARDAPPRLSGALRDIDGAFAFVIGDDRTAAVTVVTDRVGTLHVYRTRVDGCLALSTSALALAVLADRGVDPLAAQEFLATGTVFEERSMFAGVEKLPPARIVRFAAGELVGTERHWSREAHQPGAGAADPVLPLAESLRCALRRIVRRSGDVVMDLTGGFDSRALVGAALGADLPFSTVVNGAAGDPDVVAAARIARARKLEHRHFPLPDDWVARWWPQAERALALCDAECDVLEYAGVLEIHETLARRHGTSVNGSGGELFKGYWWELLHPRLGRTSAFDARRIAVARFDTDPWSRPLVRPDLAVDLKDHFTAVVDRAIERLPRALDTTKLDHVYLATRMQRWQGRIASATHRVWPNLSPFLFRAPLEIALATPPAAKRGLRGMRRLIEHLDPALAALPLADGTPASPVRVANLHRFAPAIGALAQRAGRKLTGKRRAPPARGPDLAGLLGQGPVRALLDPARMRLRSLLRPDALRRVSADPGRLRPEHVGRLLTLEMALEVLPSGGSLR